MAKRTIREELQARIRRVSQAMRAFHKDSVLLVSSGTRKPKSRDLDFSFFQDSDFFYLTDSHLEKGTLVVFGNPKKKPVLVAPVVTEHQLIWEGLGEDAKKVARRIGGTCIQSDNPLKELRSIIGDSRYVFYPNEEGQDGYKIARELVALPSHRRRSTPVFLGHTDHVLEELRMRKSPFEVSRIQSAVTICEVALENVKEWIRPGVRENVFAQKLRHAIEEQGSTESFPTIVACGPNGSILHHTPSSRAFRDGELLTLDFGALYEGYASDVTRVFLIGQKISPKLEAVYELLRVTQAGVLKKLRPGKRWRDFQEETKEELLRGLRSIGILKGSLAKLRKDRVIDRLYPHSLGHALGVSVHDVGPLRSTGETKLAPGMVLTVEPGIYSAKRIGGLSPFGMRIEDDVLITSRGAKVLTSRIPKALIP